MIKVFSGQGGGAYGSIQAGMIAEYFAREKAAAPSGAFGVSVGALNFSFLTRMVSGESELSLNRAQYNAAELEELWRGIRGNSDVYVDWPVSGFKAAIALRALKLTGLYDEVGAVVRGLIAKKDSLHDFTPLLELVSEHLAGFHWKNVAVGVTMLETGLYDEVDLTPGTYAQAVLASASIPVKASPAKLVTGWAVDGGVTNMTPLAGCFRLLGRLVNPESPEPEELWIFRCTPLKQGWWEFRHGLIAQATRTLQVLVNNIDAEDFQRAQLINDMVQLAKHSTDAKLATEVLSRYGNVKIYVVAPEESAMHAGPQSGLDFTPARLRAGLETGKRVMSEFLIDPERYELSRVLK